MEIYEERLTDKNKITADLKFIRDVLLLFRPAIIKPIDGTYRLTNYGMLKNYFKVSVRNLLRYKTFSFINIFGLAVAMAVSFLIILMLMDQHEYDAFHSNKEQIFRVHTNTDGSGIANGTSPVPLAKHIQEDYSVVSNATYLLPGTGGDLVTPDQKYAEVRGFFTDEAFFQIFDFELSEGSKSSALRTPNSIVISSEAAYKLFNDAPAVGKTVTFYDRGLDLMKIDIGSGKEEEAKDWGEFIVTGVIDMNAYKSHIKFDILVSASSLPGLVNQNLLVDHAQSWERYSSCYTYLQTAEGVDQGALQNALNAIAKEKYAEIPRLADMQLISRSLTKITPGKFVGAPMTLRLPIEAYYVLIALALVIMISASLNYTNLSIARALTRAKEIGIRKVNGAGKKNLFVQFITESILTAVLAMIMAVLLLLIISPLLGSLWISNVLTFDFSLSFLTVFAFLGFTIGIGFLAGFYPALVLSKFSPMRALKNGDEKPRKLGLRKVLSIAQFATSLLFIVTSILIFRQFNHILDFEYGFNTQQVINVPIQGNDHELIQTAFEGVSGVNGVSACEFIPALLHTNGGSFSIEQTEENLFQTEYLSVDQKFIPNMGFEMLAGQNFAEQLTDQVVVNVQLIKKLSIKSPSEAIGKTFFMGGQRAVIIRGVFRDVNFQNPIMGEGDLPLVLQNNPNALSFVNVSIAGNLVQVTKDLKASWEEIDSVHPFKSFVYEDQLSKSTKWFGDIVSVIGFITVLAVVISCLGLLGIAVYSSERRAKEVGIRKVLGASILQLIGTLSKTHAVVLSIAILLAAPLSYLVNNLWLESFPNRVEFGFGTILFSSLILIGIASFTIAGQILTISKKNPVETLKDE